MGWSSIACAGMLWSVCSPLLAADLAKIDRNIGKLPALKSEQPGYCLLVFGPDAATRVWLVRDGDLLYVDRNGNGDLTEPDEQVAAEAKTEGSEEETYSFKAGNLADGSLVHEDLRIYWYSIDHLKERDEQVRARLALNPRFRACYVLVDVEMPGHFGTGIGGRVTQLAGFQDKNGLLEFGDSRQSAPIVHFGGPWQIDFYSTEPWHIGQINKAYLAMGTPGSGEGSTVFVYYEGVIPAGNNPVLRVTFPAAGESAAPVKSHELTKRCCGVNLYGYVEAPAEAVPGVAKVEVSLASWPGATVSSSTTEIQVLPAAPRAKLEPISWRLKRTLAHVNKGKEECGVAEVQFSPDGKRLIAADYPGGVVQVWDVQSGERIATIETGEGSPTYRGFMVSPDWRTIYASTNRKGRKYERIEREGKTLTRWTFGDSIRVWDLESGELLHTWQHHPAREIDYMLLSSDGKYLLTQEVLPGDYEETYTRVCSLWDVASGERREIGEAGAASGEFSPDGKTIAVSIWDFDQDSKQAYSKAITFYGFPSWIEKSSIGISSPRTFAQPAAFSPDGGMLIGTVHVYDKPGNFRERHSFLKIWDTASGKELFELPAADHNESISSAVVSPNGGTIAAGNLQRNGGMGRVYLVDVATKGVRTIELGENAFVRGVKFHPSGNWLAIPTLTINSSEQLVQPPVDQLPQPRVQMVEVASGRIVETLIAPHSYMWSVAFRPDGNTLATGGSGEVLLWDVSTPPGSIR